MYLLLLVGHMTLAVMANTTIEFSTQVPLHTPDALHFTTGHMETSSVRAEVRTEALGASTIHTAQAHSSPKELMTTQMAHTDHKVSEHHSMYGTDIHSTGKHSTVTKKALPTSHSTGKHTDSHSTGKHTDSQSTGKHTDSQSTGKHTDSHSTGKHSTVTKKELSTTSVKVQIPQVTSKSLSMPNISIVPNNNSIFVTCFSERGPDVIHYELIRGDQILKNMTVHGKQVATFHFNITRESSYVYCRARTSSGEEAISTPMKIVGDTPESEDRSGDKTRSDKEERDAEPKFLISLTHILTSVTQQVQDKNVLIMSVCGPIILILLSLVLLTHFCKRRGHKKRSAFPASAV